MNQERLAHSVTRGAFYLSVEKAAALVSGTLYFALLLRWLGPTKYGLMTLALSFVGLATMATGNFEAFLERFAAEYHEEGRLRTLRRSFGMVLGLKLALGIVASLLLAGLAPLLAANFNAPEMVELLPILAFMVASDGFYTTGRATLYGVQQFRSVCVIAVVFHVAKTVLVGALWGAHQGLVALAIGLSVLTVLQGLAQTAVPLWMLREARDAEPARATPHRELWGHMVRYCMPLLGARVTFLSGANLGKIVLGKLFTATELGYFSFAYQTIERFVELVHTLPASLLPSFTRLVARGERGRLEWAFGMSHRLIQIVATLLAGALFVFAREITLLVGSPLFEPAVPLLRMLALVPIARTAQQPFTMLFQALRRPGTVLGLAVVKFVVEFGCYFGLVPWLGMMGAGVANLAGAVVSYVAAMAIAAREMPAGAVGRARTAGATLLLSVPLLGAAWMLDRWLPEPASFAARLVLAPLALLAAVAFGQIQSGDLERLAAIPLSSGWQRRVRDVAVETGARLLRLAPPRRAA